MVISTLLFRPSLPLLPPDRCRCLVGIKTRETCRSKRCVKVYFRPTSQAQPHGFDIRCIAKSCIGSILTLVCLVGNVKAEATRQIIEGPARVIDGDTLEVSGERIRLYGLDAPEKAQSCSDQDGRPYACGMQAKEALEKEIGGTPVRCSVKAKDLYGRSVSECSLPDIGDLGHWLVQHGYAIAYRQYSKAYVLDEEVAHQARQGVWKGDFEVPADWRREHKNGTAAAQTEKKESSITPGRKILLATIHDKAKKIRENKETHETGCDVKGNISVNGKILFSPGDRGYNSVKINTEAGERWFCGVEQAENAGWRRAKN